jgi:hypothetical protein
MHRKEFFALELLELIMAYQFIQAHAANESPGHSKCRVKACRSIHL